MNNNARKGVRSLPLQVVLFTMARLLIDTNYRMIYPYLSTFQTGLGVSLTSLSLLLTARALTGFIGPFLAPLADWRGRRLSMLLGIGAFSGGAVLVFAWPSYPTFFAGSILMGTAGLVYVPALQAFLSDRVPFERRGRIIGITELSWSLSFFIGVPLVGWLLARTGSWSSPFVFLAAIGAIFFIVLFFAIPQDRALTEEKHKANSRIDLRAALRNPGLLIGLVMAFTMASANESVNIVFGLWLENSFQMQLAALGAASVVIGLAELGGGGLSTWIVDRLGKQRAVGLGVSLNCLVSLALIFIGRTSTGALTGLFFFYLTFEFAVVSTIPLMSEAVPGLRATAIAATISAFGIGRALGSALGPFLYTHWGFPVNAVAAVVFNIATLALLSRLKIGQKQPAEEAQLV